MRKLLNTLYITKEDVNIGRDGTNLVIYQDGDKLGQYPVQYFENIVCFNYTGMSPASMALCLENKVGVSFMATNGKMLAKISGKPNGNVLLRREQFRIADNGDESLRFAKSFINGKLYNSIKVIDRGIRDYPDRDFVNELRKSKELLLGAKTALDESCNLEQLLGVEGDASRNYFKGFKHLILSQKDEFYFSSRKRRPATDPVNAILSLNYGMIRVLMENALSTVGLDSYVGFLHQDRPGRTGLALDMMEEMRAYMGDRFALNIINRKQISMNDFFIKDNGAVLFTEEGLKKYLDLWNKRLQEEIKHPFLEESINIGLIPYVQALLMARTIRGDLEIYPPFLMS